MELGKAVIRRNGLNALSGALHPRHGLVWTDGQSIFLSQVTLLNDDLENETATKLGEFDYVQSVHWSCDLGEFCYLCVVHQATVSLWKVHGTTPDLQFKQVRKINATPIPQGVLWSPVRDILCLLSKDKCSFYYRHTQNKGSYSLPPIESGKITSGCWASNGEKLVIGIGSIILIYQWHDMDTSIQEYTIIAWKIPNVEGKISSMQSVSQNRLLCTTELPLEVVCQTADADLFDISDMLSRTSDEENNLNKDDLTETEVTPCQDLCKSTKDKLMNLPRKSQLAISDSSQLVLFEIQGRALEPSKVTSTGLSNVLAPDLLCYDAQTEHATVGCNMMNSLHVFRIGENDLTKVHEISLEKSERPKGVCGVPTHCRPLSDGVLVMVGQQTESDPAFLPPTVRGNYELQLQFHSLNPPVEPPRSCSRGAYGASLDHYSSSLFKELQLPGNNARVHLLRVNKLQGESTNSSPAKGTYNKNPRLGLALPSEGHGSWSGGKGKIMLLDGMEPEVRDLETDCTDFSDQSPKFSRPFDLTTHKKDMSRESVNLVDSVPHVKHKMGLKGLLGHRSSTSQEAVNGDIITGRCNGYSKGHRQSPELPENSATVDSVLAQMISLESQVRDQCGQISQLQERVDQIARIAAETNCVPSMRYQSASEPEIVQLTWRSDDRSKVITKSFVLDNGRLQLEPVKQAFALVTVELIIDDVPCVVGANVDGYIPVRFTPRSVMEITGKRSSPVPEPRTTTLRTT